MASYAEVESQFQGSLYRLQELMADVVWQLPLSEKDARILTNDLYYHYIVTPLNSVRHRFLSHIFSNPRLLYQTMKSPKNTRLVYDTCGLPLPDGILDKYFRL